MWAYMWAYKCTCERCMPRASTCSLAHPHVHLTCSHVHSYSHMTRHPCTDLFTLTCSPNQGFLEKCVYELLKPANAYHNLKTPYFPTIFISPHIISPYLLPQPQETFRYKHGPYRPQHAGPLRGWCRIPPSNATKRKWVQMFTASRSVTRPRLEWSSFRENAGDMREI